MWDLDLHLDEPSYDVDEVVVACGEAIEMISHNTEHSDDLLKDLKILLDVLKKGNLGNKDSNNENFMSQLDVSDKVGFFRTTAAVIKELSEIYGYAKNRASVAAQEGYKPIDERRTGSVLKKLRYLLKILGKSILADLKILKTKAPPVVQNKLRDTGEEVLDVLESVGREPKAEFFLALDDDDDDLSSGGHFVP